MALYFRLTTLKIPPPNVISPIFVCNLFSLWAPHMILLTAGALTDPQLPARASNVYTTDARLGGICRVASAGWNRQGGIGRVPPPQQKSWLRRCLQCASCWPMMRMILYDTHVTWTYLFRENKLVCCLIIST